MISRIFIIAVMCVVSFNAQAADPNWKGTFTKWEGLLEREYVREPKSHTKKDLISLFRATLDRYKSIPYVADLHAYGEIDHWASRAELVNKKGGDCEDFATAAYFDLVEAGYPESSLHVVIVQKLATGEIHAYLEADNMVLDQRVHDIITTDQAAKYYKPIYAINRLSWERR